MQANFHFPELEGGSELEAKSKSVQYGNGYDREVVLEVAEQEPPGAVAAAALGGTYQVLAARPTIGLPRPGAGGAVYDRHIKATGVGSGIVRYNAICDVPCPPGQSGARSRGLMAGEGRREAVRPGAAGWASESRQPG